MSAWIHGKELIGMLKVEDFEFAREYVPKGLDPHNELGQVFSPEDVVNQYVINLEQEVASFGDVASRSVYSEDELDTAVYNGQLKEKIRQYQIYRESLQGVSWKGFELSQDPDMARHFIAVLLHSLYPKAEVEPTAHVPDKDEHTVEAKPEHPKLRYDQKCKEKCREVASRIWAKHQDTTISDMVDKSAITDIAKKPNGKFYERKTIHGWIKDLCPNRAPGRRSVKKYR